MCTLRPWGLLAWVCFQAASACATTVLSLSQLITQVPGVCLLPELPPQWLMNGRKSPRLLVSGLPATCSATSYPPGTNLVAVAVAKPLLTNGASRWSVRFWRGPRPAARTPAQAAGSCSSSWWPLDLLAPTRDDGLHKEAEGGEHGQPAVLDLLHLELCQGLCERCHRQRAMPASCRCKDCSRAH